MSDFSDFSGGAEFRKRVLEKLSQRMREGIFDELKGSLFSQFSAADSPFGSMKGSPERDGTFSYEFTPESVLPNESAFHYANIKFVLDTESVQGSAVDEEKLKAHWVDEAVKRYREASKGDGFPEGHIFVGFDPSTKTVKTEKVYGEKIIGVSLNTETAKKWLTTIKLPEGNSDGMLFKVPFSIRDYIPEDSIILTYEKGKGDKKTRYVKIIKVLEEVSHG
jgi:hypothetical protein